MALLREKDFQDLLVSYQRRERVFFVAHQAEDEVSSSWLVRGADRKEYKPDDYLVAFAAYSSGRTRHVKKLSRAFFPAT
jgi:type I restriction enzyme R subunit